MTRMLLNGQHQTDAEMADDANTCKGCGLPLTGDQWEYHDRSCKARGTYNARHRTHVDVYRPECHGC